MMRSMLCCHQQPSKYWAVGSGSIGDEIGGCGADVFCCFFAAIGRPSSFWFASCQDKGDFVSALQQLPSSPFVAMTGDGTNDLLAIKRADMGVLQPHATL